MLLMILPNFCHASKGQGQEISSFAHFPMHQPTAPQPLPQPTLAEACGGEGKEKPRPNGRTELRSDELLNL